MRQSLRQFAVLSFALVFLADALNIDALFEYGALQREDDVEQAVASENSMCSLDVSIPFSLSFAKDETTSQKGKLEIVDIDSPSLEATYVGADETATLSPEGNPSFVPLSAHTAISLYSLCRIQV
jgi:hypothetical protein